MSYSHCYKVHLSHKFSLPVSSRFSRASYCNRRQSSFLLSTKSLRRCVNNVVHATIRHNARYHGVVAETLLSNEKTPLRQSTASKHYKIHVLGAGFAGVATTWHLLQHIGPHTSIELNLIDEAGIGAGASGASGGLLHPFSPKGKYLWGGKQGWKSALELINVAETANKEISQEDSLFQGDNKETEDRFYWQRGLMRPATEEKHVLDFHKHVPALQGGINGSDEQKICIHGSEVHALLPGINNPVNGTALHFPRAITLHPERYLKALWRACQLHVQIHNEKHCPSTVSSVDLSLRKVNSIKELILEGCNGVVICLGPGASRLKELEQRLPLTMARGVVLELEPRDEGTEYPLQAPSLLGSTWVSAQGTRKVLVGATKEENNADTTSSVSTAELESAQLELLPKASALYPPINEWKVVDARAGVRAIPQRTNLGMIPIAGCLNEFIAHGKSDNSTSLDINLRTSSAWIIGGLGSRGLIYHAWLAELTARCFFEGSEKFLPSEVLQWKLMTSEQKPKRVRQRQKN